MQGSGHGRRPEGRTRPHRSGWNRTGLAVVVCIAVLLRRLWPLDDAEQVVALAAIATGAVVWALALFVGRTPAPRAGHDPRLMKRTRAAAITAGTLALALAAFALGLFSPS